MVTEAGFGRTHHRNNFGIDLLRDDTSLGGDVLQHLVQRLTLDALALQIRARVVEVEDDGALLELVDEEIGPLARRNL